MINKIFQVFFSTRKRWICVYDNANWSDLQWIVIYVATARGSRARVLNIRCLLRFYFFKPSFSVACSLCVARDLLQLFVYCVFIKTYFTMCLNSFVKSICIFIKNWIKNFHVEVSSLKFKLLVRSVIAREQVAVYFETRIQFFIQYKWVTYCSVVYRVVNINLCFIILNQSWRIFLKENIY